MPQRVVQRLAAKVPEDPLEFWLGRLDDDTEPAHRSHFERWMKWLHTQPGWADVTPRELLIRQLDADDSYVIVDLLQSYVGSLVLRKSSKQKAHSVIRSFFAHNRCALPADPSFRIRGDRPPVDAKLTVEDVVGACHAATIRYQSIILVKWQSFLDNARLVHINRHCADEIVKQIQTGTHPVRIDLAGRKENENDIEGRFSTFIGKDAVDALTRYFEEERGWPHPGEPLWIQTNRKPLQKATMESTWLHMMRHMGKIPKRKGPIGSRYGYNLHEMRDVATTYLHVQAKAEGLDMDCVKFWCGQVGQIDPLKYDKFYKEKEYTRAQYLIAEKHLNIITGQPQQLKTVARENEELRERLAKLEGQFETILKTKFESEKAH
jgi:hypothetical protein